MKTLILFTNLFAFALCIDFFYVTLPDGSLKGYIERSGKVPFYAFLDVPYGKPPVGNLRFQSPQPVEPWEGIRDAFWGTKVCMQISNSTQGNDEQEDCLYLQVYTPVRPDANASLPVMVHIYGGGFVNGAGHFWANGPHYLMESGVVVVSINYRVGAFGFLATGDTVLPGNYGLKDQLLALKWVKNNIRHFSGDPNKVTIFGQSAGGASVTFHMMSKKSKGLFRAAIAESGSSLCPWAYQRNYKQYAYALATYLNPNFKKNASSKELLEYLRSVPAKKLKEAQQIFQENIDNTEILEGYWFTPVVEPEHSDAFITELQYDTIRKGQTNKVPLMIGMCSEEQIWWAGDLSGYKWCVNHFDENVTALVNNNMKMKDSTEMEKAGKAIRSLYTPTTFKDKIGGLVRYISDMSFSKSLITHAKLQSQYSDVYFYEFAYHGKLGNNNINLEGAERVGHTEDLNYVWVWGNNTNLNTYPAQDVRTSERYRTLMTNFVKHLTPTPKKEELFGNVIWPKVTPEKFQYLDINETLTVKTNPKGDVYPGWVAIYEKYAVKPYDTY